MSDSMALLRQAFSQDDARPSQTWDTLLGALRAVTSAVPSAEADELYLQILCFGGRLRIAPGSTLPHSMSPEEMLKSLAMAALGDRASAAHREAIARIRAGSKSPRLAALAAKYLGAPSTRALPSPDRANFVSHGGLRASVTWEEPVPQGTAAEVTRGGIVLWVCGELVWGEEVGHQIQPVSSKLVDLLDHLATAWVYLEFEEGYPLGLMPAVPSRLRESFEDSVQDLPENLSRVEEDEVSRFEGMHDLARGLPGASVPSVWLVREGLFFTVCTERRTVLAPAREVLGCLSLLGDTISNRLQAATDERARLASREWEQRHNRTAPQLAEIATRLPAVIIAELAEVAPTFGSHTGIPDFPLSELVVAARMMAGALSTENIKKAIQAITTAAKVATPKLDRLSSEAAKAGELRRSGIAWDEGHRLASWFRARMGIGEDEPVRLEHVLDDLGVQVNEIDIDDVRLDAIACWGPLYGPAVFINVKGKHTRSAGGRYVTQAHELGHLLIDRDGSLPVAEVLNGMTPKRVEARARAFAAEFLLPKRVAGQAAAAGTDVLQVIAALRAKYRVSQEVAAWQIKNSGVRLLREQVIQLRPLVSDPASF